MGVTELGGSIKKLLRAFRVLRQRADLENPDLVILVDFPDFNLKLAKSLKKRGHTIIYYISPQLWAWRKYRVATIRKYVDLMLTILPFENAWYEAQGVNHAEYVGHPLANEVTAVRSKGEFCRDTGLDESKPIISLLPGSRHKEISFTLPVMLEAATSMTAADGNIQFVVPIVSNKDRADVDAAIKRIAPKANLTVVEGATYDALNASDAAAVTSGTATLETGIIGTPLVIVYKGTALNYALLKPLISVEHYGLINLIAGERIAKELIQHELTPESVAAELTRLLEPQVNAAMRQRLRDASDNLGHGGASRRAAQAVLRLIENQRV